MVNVKDSEGIRQADHMSRVTFMIKVFLAEVQNAFKVLMFPDSYMFQAETTVEKVQTLRNGVLSITVAVFTV